MPTMVIDRPKKTYSQQGVCMKIICDDGEYTATQLAQRIGIATSSLIGRAQRHGWLSPAIFRPRSNKGRKIVEGEIDFQNEGNAEWKAMKRPAVKCAKKKLVEVEWKTLIDPRM